MKKMILLLLVLLVIPTVSAYNVTITDILADTYIQHRLPTTNSGTENTIETGIQTSEIIYGLYTWNISKLQDRNITNAIFHYFVGFNQYNEINMTLYKIEKSWDEGNVTWLTFPCFNGSSYGWNTTACNLTPYAYEEDNLSGVTNPERYILINITNLLRSYESSNQNVSFFINITGQAPAVNERIWTGSKESSNISKIPYITIQVVGILNITAKEIGNASLSNFSLYVNNVFEGATTSGYYEIVKDAGKYNITVTSVGYQNQTQELTINMSNNAYEFELNKGNSFLFTFRDEETDALVNNVELDIISDSFSNNYTTANGTIYVTKLSADYYIFRYSSAGYNEGFYYSSLINPSSTNITLYFLTNTSASVVTATVYDERRELVEGAYINVLRYDLASNSYILREVVRTNNEGIAKMNLQLNTEYYKFIIEYPLGTVKKSIEPSYIYSTSITFQINLGTGINEDFYSVMDVSGDVDFNNASKYFRFTYLDHNSAITQACLFLYKYQGSLETLFNSTCSPATSGMLVLYAPPLNNTYRADGYVYFGDEGYIIDSESHDYGQKGLGGIDGLFWTVVVMFIFACIGYWNLTVAVILTPLPLIFSSLLKIIDMNIGLTIGIEVLAIIVAVWLSKR